MAGPKHQRHHRTEEAEARVCRLTEEATGRRETRQLMAAAEGHGGHSAAPGGSSTQATLCPGKLGQGSWFPFHLF